MLASKLNWNEDAKLDALCKGMSYDLCRLLLGKTKKLTFDELVALSQETDTESCPIHLSKGRSYHQRNSQGHAHPRAPATTMIPNPPQNGAGQAPHPDAMDLSMTGGRGKILEEEWAARLREGCCLYCGGVRHMARHCPHKTKNTFRAASVHMEGNPNPNTFANPFSGGGGGGNKGVGGTGGQDQLGNA